MAHCSLRMLTSFDEAADCIAYVSDQRKTSIPHDDGILTHIDEAADMLLQDRYISVQYLAGVRTAAREFRNTRERFCAQTVNYGIHVVQSFHPGETTDAAQVHRMGCQLAASAFPRCEAVIATHTNTANLHSHIIANPVSFIDGNERELVDASGERYPAEQWRIQKFLYILDISDRIAIDNGLSPLITGTPKFRGTWKNRVFASAARELINQDIRRAAAVSKSTADLTDHLRTYGYTITSDTDGTPVLQPPGHRRKWRIDRFYETWEIDQMTAFRGLKTVLEEEAERQDRFLRPRSCKDNIGGRLTAFEAQFLYWLNVLRMSALQPALTKNPAAHEIMRLVACFRRLRKTGVRTEADLHARTAELVRTRDELAAEVRSLRLLLTDDTDNPDVRSRIASCMSAGKDITKELRMLETAQEAAFRGLKYENEHSREKSLQSVGRTGRKILPHER